MKGYTRFRNPLDRILTHEGIDREPPKGAKLPDLHGESLRVFHTILHESDPRWRLVYQHLRLREEGILRPLREEHNGRHYESALRAHYLSKYFSVRHGFGEYRSLEALRQLARAVVNLDVGSKEAPKFDALAQPGKGYRIELVRTNRYDHGKDEIGWPACPEALWQLRLYRGKAPIGRIAFNFHVDGGRKVVSVTGVQGIESQEERWRQAGENLAEKFGAGSFLVKRLKEALGTGFEYRMVKPQQPQNRKGSYESLRVLYEMTARGAKIPPRNRYTI
ncbi:MAG: hypothetical protein V1708_03605 [Candidatus Micrarchaeota archaeon]